LKAKNKKKISITCVVGARPNFIKIAPIISEMKKHASIRSRLIHTGQHHDYVLSELFFRELSIKEPDIYLGTGSSSHAVQTGNIMIGLEKVFMKSKPNLVLVVGDVNSTLAAVLTCSKMGIPSAHIEAGLRSRDPLMPEEVNRIITDRLSEYLFTTSRDADENLIKEGIEKSRIFFTGNVMIDTLLKLLPHAKMHDEVPARFGVKKNEYVLLTLHRPSNVDNKETFLRIIRALDEISKSLPIIFPIHPRTEKNIELFKLKRYFKSSKIKLIKPIGYLENLNLMLNSKFVLTDSGGIQEETTVLKKPCLTLRENTERPVTETVGSNTIVGTSTKKILNEFDKIMSGKYKKGHIPKYWDGRSAERIVKILKSKLLVQ
jgi:UDP-N-acetylglucosamine 2-epimerase (non-hydrolysing)